MSRFQLTLAAWSTLMCMAALALLAMDVRVRSQPAPHRLEPEAGPLGGEQDLKQLLSGMAERVPKFLDRLSSDGDLEAGLASTQAAMQRAREHAAAVMGDRSALPQLDLQHPDAFAANGQQMQIWLRGLADVLPELATAMHGDVDELTDSLQQQARAGTAERGLPTGE